MKTVFVAAIVCLASLSRATAAGSYIQQSTFTLAMTSVSGLDTDSVGNLYVLGLTPGAHSYQVRGYQMPGFAPQFSFDTGVSSPAAFAVESSGIIDVLESSGTLRLKRFNNIGSLVASSTYTIPASGVRFLSASIDKVNERLMLGFQFSRVALDPLCPNPMPITLGPCPYVTETLGGVNQYDFNGNELVNVSLSGNNYIGGCYTPTDVGVDSTGSFYVADGGCKQILPFTSTGTAKTAFALSGVPTGIWTDSTPNLYVNEPVCSPTGCPYGIAKLNASGAIQTSLVGGVGTATAADTRMLYTVSSGTLSRWIFDSPPSVPTEKSPLGMTIQHPSAASLTWQASSDPDSDPVAYSVFLGTAPGSLVLISTTSQTTAITDSLAFGATYYWQIVSQDLYQGLPVLQAAAPVVSFNLNLLDTPPQAPALLSPSPAISTMRGSANVSWQPVSDQAGDPIIYTVKLGGSAQNMQTVSTIYQSSGTLSVSAQPAPAQPLSQVQLSGGSIQLSLFNLGYYQTYYAQVIAATPWGANSSSPVQSFSLSPQNNFPKAYNYPNPFNPNRGGTNLVFNAPPSGYAGATVEIYSEWQDLLFKQDYPSIPPGVSQVHIDGRDRFGRPFFNGSYICRVTFSGPDDKQIFFMLVVK